MSDFTPTGNPQTLTRGVSPLIRNEFALIQTAVNSKADKSGSTYTGAHDFSGATVSLGDVVMDALSVADDMDLNNHKITELADATAQQDAVNLRTAQAIFSGGGTPSNIPITGLGVGTATAEQYLRINDAGTAVEGTDPPVGAILYAQAVAGIF
jgi:hypothetical protein